MQALKSLFILLPFVLQGRRLFAESSTPVLPLLFRSFSLSTKAKTQTPQTTSPITNYLITTFKFSKTLALSVSTRFYWIKTPEKPQSVILFLQDVGLSESHIRSAVRVCPQILFSDVDKILKPKMDFFRDLGLVGSELGKFISKNSPLLCVSLERKLLPCVHILKKVLCKDNSNEDLIRVLRRCNWVVRGDPESRLMGNIAFLRSCGIVGSQLSMLLTRQPWLFVTEESKLKDFVSRALHMGFALNSRMLVYALYTISCMSNETFTRKLDLFRTSGFSSDKCIDMFRKQPSLLRTSEEKLKLGIEFFMGTMKWEKSALVSWPACFMFSLENRVIPRYKVMEILKSNRLLKDPSFAFVLNLTEEEFLAKFITKFGDHAEELLVAYEGHLLDSSSEDKS